MLANASRAGAVCNQVCADNNSNTFFGVAAGDSVSGTINTGFGVGALGGNLSGKSNTAIGSSSLAGDTSGSNNTAAGTFALISNTTGSNNTATGSGALFENDTGDNNTANGQFALANNVGGANNTATGYQALVINNTGSNNTAAGAQALSSNTADNNTATGANALFSNQKGDRNTAIGMNALFSNTSGNTNTATGQRALFANTAGHHNTADGLQSMLSNTTGTFNTATGLNALGSNTSGGFNIAMGAAAGYNLTTGSNNIDIGNRGAAGESNTIRLGTQGTQTATFIAGISGTPVSGPDVVVSSTGKLGIVASSARYKKDITDMGARSDGVMKLRPVTFRYKNDEQGVTQYGLVAEEVEKVYPELVTYGADGKVETVRYSMLTSMLLNEVQKRISGTNNRLLSFAQDEHIQQQPVACGRQKHRAAASRRANALQRSVTQRFAALTGPWPRRSIASFTPPDKQVSARPALGHMPVWRSAPRESPQD